MGWLLLGYFWVAGGGGLPGHYFWNRLDNVQFGHELKNQFILCLLFVFFSLFSFLSLTEICEFETFFYEV